MLETICLVEERKVWVSAVPGGRVIWEENYLGRIAPINVQSAIYIYKHKVAEGFREGEEGFAVIAYEDNEVLKDGFETLEEAITFCNEELV